MVGDRLRAGPDSGDGVGESVSRTRLLLTGLLRMYRKPSLELGGSTVDEKFRTGGEGALVSGQVEGGGGDLVGAAGPA